MTIVRAILFTILIPGTIAVYLPSWLAQRYPAQFPMGDWRYTGLLLMSIGFFVYLLSAFAFLVEGGGTPAIWFTKPIRFLIGEEPRKLVRGKLYKLTRNPMYLGVATFVLGMALWLESQVLLLYTVALWLCFHLVIVFIEEPHLRRKNGEQYEEYARTVPRWIGFRSRR
jgi:protein-S-isoprenylcysteine O-methyltransferase Ste14